MIRSKSGIEIPTTLAEWCDPQRMALIVYDMQVGICSRIKGAEVAIERTATVLQTESTAIRCFSTIRTPSGASMYS